VTCFKQPLLTFAHNNAKQAGNVDINDAAQASSAVRIVPFRTLNALGSGRSANRNLQTANMDGTGLNAELLHLSCANNIQQHICSS
jgi:hypothetical protein